MNTQDPNERTAEAGEYVLGTLNASERQAFESAMSGDEGLRREVYAWQGRLLGLTRRLQPVVVPPELWARIAARLNGASQFLTVPVSSADGLAANDALWSSVRFWRWLSGGAVAAAVVMSVLLVRTVVAPPAGVEQAQTQAPRYLAVLQSPDNAATGWIVETVGTDAIRLVQVGEGAAIPEGKTMQFWTKPEGAAGPTSLGLVKPGQVVVVPKGQLPGLADRTLFELTLEPAGGSPYDRPSGPILFVGKAVRL
ncbi:anti-sigma factor [Aquabacterium parvum]|uniref:anti-sigma factor n=1 Tax=Aquabacterium parvum TaxID=70584 RepID=UPI000718D006|nr:anti-sigma factor [Aquabacterium parvum]MBU0916401.1 anti-sigma factor [Gammaproteobacteria bacterium]